MPFIIFVIFLFFVLIPLVLGSIIPIYKEHYKSTANVINHDFVMRKFVYKVYLSRAEILEKLNLRNAADELTCKLDADQALILFSEYGSTINYAFDIQEFDGFSILRLTQIPLLTTQSSIPLKLNPFILKKLDAEIIPFALYGDL